MPKRQPGRGYPDSSVRESILIAQRGLCHYCQRPLDGYVFRGGKVTWLRVEWDHFTPFAYLGSNPDDNWVASCQVCNGIKSSLMFKTSEEAHEYIRERAEQLGYSDVRPSADPFSWVQDRGDLLSCESDESEPDKSLSVSCPVCGAKPGWMCVSRTAGRPLEQIHVTRGKALIRANQVPGPLPSPEDNPVRLDCMNRAHLCPVCDEPTGNHSYCDDCRCAALNSRGKRCGNRVHEGDRCYSHPLEAA